MANVLFVATEDWFFFSHRLFLAIEAQKRGHRVFLACRLRHHQSQIERHGIVLVNLELNRNCLSPIGFCLETLKTALLYSRLKPDLVYHLALRPVVVGGFAATLTGNQCVVSSFAGLGHLFSGEEHPGVKIFILRYLIRIAAGRGKCLVENQEDRNSISACGISKERIDVLPGSGVNPFHFTPSFVPKSDSFRPVVMMASRLIWPKGVGVFVDAAKICRAWGLSSEFVLVGEPDRDNPESIPSRMIQSWNRQGLVNWLGGKADMNSIFKGADIFCLPTSYREGMPKVLLEAMACGLPCITTNTRGCREAVRHGKNGLLIPPNDPHALALAIRRLVDSAELREKMGKAGREIAVNEYNEERVCNRTMELFEEILKSKEYKASRY